MKVQALCDIDNNNITKNYYCYYYMCAFELLECG